MAAPLERSPDEAWAYSVSGWNRRRKWKLFTREMEASADTSLLDVGFSNQEYSSTDNFIEKHYPYPENITALGIEEPELFTQRYPMVRVVQYNGALFPFDDASFDIVWSNAVVEHVGSRENQIRFLKEVARVGRRAWVTTPNRLFPIEVHTRRAFIHWLPKARFDALLRKRGDDWAAGDYMRLLSGRELRRLLAEAGITKYRIKRNRIGPFTLDFVVIIM